MPAKLIEETEKVTWRIGVEDMATLRAAYGDRHVNAAVRALLGRFCERLRAAQPR